MLKKQGHPALYQIAAEVPTGENLTGLLKNMRVVMRAHAGVGLAANQIGELKRVIIIDVSGLRLELINPVITRAPGGRINGNEGCLSFPGLQVRVLRHRQIVVEGFDSAWRPVKRKLKGLAARVVQHEIDHLNGSNII